MVQTDRFSRLSSRGVFHHSLLFVLLAIVVGGMLTACGVDLQNPPRLATATAQAAVPLATRSDPLELVAPTNTPEAGGTENPTFAPTEEITPSTSFEGEGLTIWVDETSPEHRRVLSEITGEFADRYGVNVAVQLVSPALLPGLAATGVLSEDRKSVV